jgi:putative Mg2+ transporter-C (MgtC) family protein
LLDWNEIILRLGVATLAGGLIGLDRDLHGKPVGLKTLGLVGLAAAMVMVTVMADQTADTGKFSDAASRIVQGILTGIGFLGAGVIVHEEQHLRVRGLTSAASVWLTACVGTACGLGHWRIVATALSIALLLLIFGHRTERWPHNALGGEDDHGEDGEPRATSPDGPINP